MKNGLYIHVGLQKTGTTFLQEKVFKRLPVNYVRYFDRELYSSRLDRSRPTLVSNEDLCGAPHEILDPAQRDSRYRIAENLAALFPQARVIVGLREPDAWLRSLHKEAIRQGLTMGFSRFYRHFDKDMLNFPKYVGHLKRLFLDVYVYNFEALKEDHLGVIEGLCDFMEVPVPENIDRSLVNASLEDWQLPGFRILNKALYSKGYNHVGIIPRTWFGYAYGLVRKDGMQ